MRENLSAQRGVTMLELLVVVALLGILALFAIPNIRAGVVKNRVMRPISELGAIVSVARLEAINGRGQGILAFHRRETTDDEFKDEPWAGMDTAVVFLDRNGNGKWDGQTNEPIKSRYSLNQYVSFSAPGGGDPIAADGWSFLGESLDDRVIYGPTGGILPGRTTPLTATLGDERGNFVRLVFNPVTGQVHREKNVPGTEQWRKEGSARDWKWVY